MKAVMNGLDNNKYRFETYTDITEDLFEIAGMQSNTTIREIVASKDEFGHEVIFANTGQGIFVYHFSEGDHSFKSGFINFSCSCLNVRISGSGTTLNPFGFVLYGIKSDGHLYGIVYKKTKQCSKEYLVARDSFKYPDGSYMELLFSMNYNGGPTYACNSNLVEGCTETNFNTKIFRYEVTQGTTSYVGGYSLPVKNVVPLAHVIYGCNVESYGLNTLYKVSAPQTYALYTEIFKGATTCRNITLPADATEIKFKSVNHRARTYPFMSLQSAGQFHLGLIPTNKFTPFLSGKHYTDYQVKITEGKDGLLQFHFIVKSKEKNAGGAEVTYLWHYVYDRQFNLISEGAIDTNVSAYYLVQDDYGVILYCAGQCVEGRNAIERLEYDVVTGEWHEYDIETPPADGVERLPCYTTEVIVKESASGIPAENIDVRLYAEANVLIDTSTGLHEVGPSRKITLKTDASGKIYFTQYTSSVYSVPVKLEIPVLSSSVISLNQYEIAEKRLREASVRDFLSAVKVDPFGKTDEYMIPSSMRTEGNAEAIQYGIREMMKFKPTSNYTHGMMGAYLQDENGGNEAINIETDSCWSLTSEGNKLIFKKLTEEEAAANLANMMADSNTNPPFGGFLKSIGNFLRSIGKKIVQVVETVVKGAIIGFTYIYNGIRYAINFVIEKLSHVFDAIGALFGQILVFFVDIFMWLIFGIRWSDIIKVKNALSQGMTAFTDKLPLYLQAKSNVVINGIEKSQKNVTAWLNDAKRQMTGKTFNDITKQNSPPQANQVMNNNLALRKLNDIKGDVSMTTDFQLEMTPEMNAIVDDIANILKQAGDEINASTGYKAVMSYFEKKTSSVSTFFSFNINEFIDLLFGMVQLTIDVVCALIKKLIQFITELFKSMAELFKKPIKVPFFSGLYKSISGGAELSLMDLSLLVTAFCVTLTHKLVKGSIPFKDDAEVRAYVNIFNVFNVKGHDEDAKESAAGVGAALLTITTACFGIASLAFTTVADAKGSKADTRWTYVSGICGILAWGVSYTFALTTDELNDALLGVYIFALLHIATNGVIGYLNDFKLAAVAKLAVAILVITGLGHFASTVAWNVMENPRAHDAVPEYFYSMRESVSFLSLLDGHIPKIILCSANGLVISGVFICMFISLSSKAEENVEEICMA